ncbi:hypothetical protein RB25_23090 [Herbaspirillum rubrisubalbicans]|uniref:Glutamine amidotransferase domain-containing protein n=1 Tax=Herbaspirillum rubrisubalbicans TaxID=80842 RepID=A0ABX9BXE6_9BURK|nr:glutamine amidotransferase [Herbaspirillum rubrisubalbicans]RAM62617.1 hypothetical protein RB24_20095 [Herbaspirillum rubrisubalbicans]RAN43653.1 hypothetical protein RB25_23090 [Herbaspirillum rubrisubalbicans]
MNSAAKLPILLVLHRAQSTAGRVGRALTRLGYGLDIRRPPLGEKLPASLERHGGAIVFGGPMSANDPEPWIREEIDWIGTPLTQQKPFLGICLGAQMLALHLGAKVAARSDGKVEIGYGSILAARAGRAMGPWPGRVYQWHREGFQRSTGMTLLASSPDFENQAIAYGTSAYGLQFHPEVSLQMAQRWSAAAQHKLQQPGAQDRLTQLRLGRLHDRECAVWLYCFLERWLRSDALVTR